MVDNGADIKVHHGTAAAAAASESTATVAKRFGRAPAFDKLGGLDNSARQSSWVSSCYRLDAGALVEYLERGHASDAIALRDAALIDVDLGKGHFLRACVLRG